MQKLKHGYILCAITLLNLICLGVAVEVPFRIAHNILDYHHDHGSWSLFHLVERQTHDEHTCCATSYQPYEEYRLQPLQGGSVTIGQDGFRIVPDQYPLAPSTIYILGDSTTLGPASNDSQTISAVLQRLFNTQTHLKVNVYNRGIGAWSSFQEVIYLVEQLKSGHVPNVVVLYGGVTEISRALQNGSVRTTWYHKQLTHFFNGDSDLVNIVAGQRHFFRIRFLSFIIKKLRKHHLMNGPFIPFVEQPDFVNTQSVYPQLSEAQKNLLAKDVFDNLQENIRLVKKLSELYHFSFYVFWQPLLYPSVSHKPLASEEKALVGQELYAGFADLTARVMPYVKADPQDIENLGNAFDQTKEKIFNDPIHIAPSGDEKIAELIFKRLIHAPRLQPA